ncbi:hypothetical protein PTKIN_Ptkin05aG0103200 [Pterospermum kingtungense]
MAEDLDPLWKTLRLTEEEETPSKPRTMQKINHERRDKAGWSIAERIGRRLGKLLAMDESLEGGGWAAFLRLRVMVDLTKPLRRTIKLAGGEDKRERWGRLAYERLPTFCYRCGLLGHADIDCEAADSGQTSNPELLQYGDWMRAIPFKKRTRFNKQLSSSAKTNAFFAQMKAFEEGIGKTENNLSVRRGGPVRRLELRDSPFSKPTLKLEADGRQYLASDEVDYPKVKEAGPKNLHQKSNYQRALEKEDKTLHVRGKSDRNQENVKTKQHREVRTKEGETRRTDETHANQIMITSQDSLAQTSVEAIQQPQAQMALIISKEVLAQSVASALQTEKTKGAQNDELGIDNAPASPSSKDTNK